MIAIWPFAFFSILCYNDNRKEEKNARYYFLFKKIFIQPLPAPYSAYALLLCQYHTSVCIP